MTIIAETKRLILRKFMEKDLSDLYEYLSNPNVVLYEPYGVQNEEEVRQTLHQRINSDEMIAVELKANHKMIGNLYLGKLPQSSLELGYVFNEDYWNMGYAKEACMKIIEMAFSKGTHRIQAKCDPKNKASWNLLEKLEFIREGHLKKNVYFNVDKNSLPIWKDTYIYSKLNN